MNARSRCQRTSIPSTAWSASAICSAWSSSVTSTVSSRIVASRPRLTVTMSPISPSCSASRLIEDRVRRSDGGIRHRAGARPPPSGAELPLELARELEQLRPPDLAIEELGERYHGRIEPPPEPPHVSRLSARTLPLVERDVDGRSRGGPTGGRAPGREALELRGRETLRDDRVHDRDLRPEADLRSQSRGEVERLGDRHLLRERDRHVGRLLRIGDQRAHTVGLPPHRADARHLAERPRRPKHSERVPRRRAVDDHGVVAWPPLAPPLWLREVQ